jgi:hypothetical protein
MFLEAASKVTGIFLPSQARLVGKKTRFPSAHVLSGFLRSQGQLRPTSNVRCQGDAVIAGHTSDAVCQNPTLGGVAAPKLRPPEPRRLSAGSPFSRT